MSLQVRMKTMALARAKEKAIAEEAAQACKRRSRRKETSLPAMLTVNAGGTLQRFAGAKVQR